jgi:hypothetical protein
MNAERAEATIVDSERSPGRARSAEDEATQQVEETEGGPPIGRAELKTVPAGGVAVWADADPTRAPIAQLDEGNEVIVVGRRGSWVHVQAHDGLDGWVDGSQLAGVQTTPVDPAAAAEPHSSSAAAPATAVVVDKAPSTFRLGRGPIIGAAGALVAIFGTALAWQQTVANRLEVDAYGIPLRFLTGWENLADQGFALGWLIVILAAVGAVVSIIAGGGIVRRILGLAIIIVCFIYVLQQQEWLSSIDRGLGTGLNVWDLVGVGVPVTFLGGLTMLFAPSR